MASEPTALIATGLMGGEKLYQKRARRAFPILVRQAKAHQTITYENLASELDMPNPRNLNFPLGAVGDAIRGLNKSRILQIPLIQAIVINKNTGLPGPGINEFLPPEVREKVLGSNRKTIFRAILNEVFHFNEWDAVLIDLNLEPLTFESDPFELERLFRTNMFNRLLETGSSKRVKPQLLHKLGFYQGQAGIWRDKNRTSLITSDEVGITVSLVHRGDHYPDELSENGLTYHYPATNRLGVTDKNEIEATKIASAFSLPIFIILTNKSDATLRDVKIGYITEWNDVKQTFQIRFSSTKPDRIFVKPRVIKEDPIPFRLNDETGQFSEYAYKGVIRKSTFKKDVMSRYGAACIVCDLDIATLLDGAHIKSKKYKGSDDARNGLVLCATHHRAFDRKLLFINPETFKIHQSKNGPSLEELRVTRKDLSHLSNLPHEDALRWHWDNWY